MTYSVEDAINIEGGVHGERRLEYRVPHVAPRVRLDARTRQGQKPVRRIREVFVVRVVARRGHRIELVHECVVEGEHVAVLVYKVDGGDLFLDDIP